jgi:hypothetical protein
MLLNRLNLNVMTTHLYVVSFLVLKKITEALSIWKHLVKSPTVLTHWQVVASNIHLAVSSPIPQSLARSSGARESFFFDLNACIL